MNQFKKLGKEEEVGKVVWGIIFLAIILLIFTIVSNYVKHNSRPHPQPQPIKLDTYVQYERQSAVGWINAIYTEIYEPETNSVKKTGLIKTKGLPDENFKTATVHFLRFKKLFESLENLAPGYDKNDLPEKFWQEIGIPKIQGDFLYWFCGQNAAQALFNLAMNPPRKNGQDLIAPFKDRADIIAHVQDILEEINSSPANIGQTNMAIRKIAINDLVKNFKRIDTDIKAGRIDKYEGFRLKKNLKKRAIDDWHYDLKG